MAKKLASLFGVAALIVFSACGMFKPPTGPSFESGPEIPPYNRNDWQHWIDEDGDCQDTRQEVLIRDADGLLTFKPRADLRQCDVLSGRWIDPYSGAVFTNPSDIDIDHLVPLRNAHLSGGWAWDSARRRDYANYLQDVNHLIAVWDSLNQSKGDKGPDRWKPPNQSYWCDYARAWESIKNRWLLSMTTAEAAAVGEMKKICP